jgi:hypothetical protein
VVDVSLGNLIECSFNDIGTSLETADSIIRVDEWFVRKQFVLRDCIAQIIHIISVKFGDSIVNHTEESSFSDSGVRIAVNCGKIKRQNKILVRLDCASLDIIMNIKILTSNGREELTTDMKQKDVIAINLEESIVVFLVLYPVKVDKHTKRQGLAETART